MGAGLLWELAKETFLFFASTSISVSNLVNGSVAAVVAIMSRACLRGLILLLGAYVGVSRSRHSQQQREAAGES